MVGIGVGDMRDCRIGASGCCCIGVCGCGNADFMFCGSGCRGEEMRSIVASNASDSASDYFRYIKSLPLVSLFRETKESVVYFQQKKKRRKPKVKIVTLPVWSQEKPIKLI